MSAEDAHRAPAAAATVVLVIGAAGKTGLAVTRALRSRGVTVRAAVRSRDRFETARNAGAQSCSVVDLETGAGLTESLVGVGGVYHLAPNMHPDEVGIADRMAAAAVEAGVGRFVFHSVLHPDDASMPHHLRKAEAEQVVRGHLPRATVLRPAAYHQNLVPAALSGRLAVPYSLDAPFTTVDLDDVAQVAAIVLTCSGHEGRTLDLVGPQTLTVRQQAEVATTVLGRPVEAVCLSLQSWLDGPGTSLSTQVRDDIVAMFAAYDQSGLVGDATTLRRLLQREPGTWEQSLRS